MKQTDGGGHIWSRAAIAVIAVGSAFALTACGDDSDDNGGATAAMSSGSETVSVDSLGGAGDVLVDNDGAALYTPDQEANGKILCASADCTAIWKPLSVSGGSPTGSSDIEGELGTIKRPDGDTQVTFDGKPLYSFTEESAGEVTGDGFEDDFDGTHFVWRVVTPTGVSPSGSSSGDSDTGDSGGGSGYSY